MTLRNTLDTTDVQQRVDGVQAMAVDVQSDRVRSLLGAVVATGTSDAEGTAQQPIELLRDRYDRGSEAYLNGAICRIEYAHIVEQINQMIATLVAPEILVAANGAEIRAPQQGRAKGRGGKGKSGLDAKSDAGFAAIVRRTHIRLAGLNRADGDAPPRPC